MALNKVILLYSPVFANVHCLLGSNGMSLTIISHKVVIFKPCSWPLVEKCEPNGEVAEDVEHQ